MSYFRRLGIEIGAVALEPSQCSVGFCKGITGRGERAGLTDRPSIYLGPTVEIGRSSHSTVSRLLDPTKGVQVDGIFGSQTDAAVRGFQHALSLDIPSVTVDEIVGPITWQALVSGMLSG